MSLEIFSFFIFNIALFKKKNKLKSKLFLILNFTWVWKRNIFK